MREFNFIRFGATMQVSAIPDLGAVALHHLVIPMIARYGKDAFQPMKTFEADTDFKRLLNTSELAMHGSMLVEPRQRSGPHKALRDRHARLPRALDHLADRPGRLGPLGFHRQGLGAGPLGPLAKDHGWDAGCSRDRRAGGAVREAHRPPKGPRSPLWGSGGPRPSASTALPAAR